MSKRIQRRKADRQGTTQDGMYKKDNEYGPKQRNPEPTLNVGPPPAPKPGEVEARFDGPTADGDNRATSEEVGTEEPFVPLPHETPEWSESPEGNLMRIVELLAVGEIQKPQAQPLFETWIRDNMTNIKSREDLMKQVEFFSGRLKRSMDTALESFHSAVSIIPLPAKKR
jgi:hypothetical protein